MMVIKANVFKVFLICSNVLLLCAGLTILILGIKMLVALSVLSLISIPQVKTVVNSVITTGAFITMSSLWGLLGCCIESKGLLVGHLISLGVIVILEFSIGVTLMTIKRSVSEAIESSDCNNMCTASFDAAILDYALPSAGLMMSVIFVEALMIYSCIRLYFFIRDGPTVTLPSEQTVVMQNVPEAEAVFSTQLQPTSSSRRDVTTRQYQLDSAYEGPVRRSQSNIEDRPPDYHSLSHYPPPYTYEMRYGAAGSSAAPDAEQPKDTDDSFNQV